MRKDGTKKWKKAVITAGVLAMNYDFLSGKHDLTEIKTLQKSGVHKLVFNEYVLTRKTT